MLFLQMMTSGDPASAQLVFVQSDRALISVAEAANYDGSRDANMSRCTGRSSRRASTSSLGGELLTLANDGGEFFVDTFGDVGDAFLAVGVGLVEGFVDLGDLVLKLFSWL